MGVSFLYFETSLSLIETIKIDLSETISKFIVASRSSFGVQIRERLNCRFRRSYDIENIGFLLGERIKCAGAIQHIIIIVNLKLNSSLISLNVYRFLLL